MSFENLIKKDKNSSPSTVSETQAAARSVAEVQAQLAVSKKFPRNQSESLSEVLEVCDLYSLASQSSYKYPRGGKEVTGPSIRLAEVLAQSWGNITFGFRELESNDRGSSWEAFCWDTQKNVYASRTFSVKHERHTRKGVTKLTDPRDIYEIGANNAARRLRACILQVIPKWVCEEAMKKCKETLINSAPGGSLLEKTNKMSASFQTLGVSVAMLETYLGHSLKDTNADEFYELRSIYQSIKEGMFKREDYFAVKEKKEPSGAKIDINTTAKKPSGTRELSIDLGDQDPFNEDRKK